MNKFGEGTRLPDEKFGRGTCRDPGWIMADANADIRSRMRRAFRAWHDFANNEQDQNRRIPAVRLRDGVPRINRGEAFCPFDFEHKTAD